MPVPTQDQIRQALSSVEDPEIKKPITELGREREQKWANYLLRLQELGIPYPTPVAPKFKPILPPR